MYKKWTLLELIEKFPQLENKIRSYDEAAGCCLLCTCLFDRLETIEKERNIDFSDLYNRIGRKTEDV